jgi:hypothetical protein
LLWIYDNDTLLGSPPAVDWVKPETTQDHAFITFYASPSEIYKKGLMLFVQSNYTNNNHIAYSIQHKIGPVTESKEFIVILECDTDTFNKIILRGSAFDSMC